MRRFGVHMIEKREAVITTYEEVVVLKRLQVGGIPFPGRSTLLCQ